MAYTIPDAYLPTRVRFNDVLFSGCAITIELEKDIDGVHRMSSTLKPSALLFRAIEENCRGEDDGPLEIELQVDGRWAVFDGYKHEGVVTIAWGIVCDDNTPIGFYLDDEVEKYLRAISGEQA